MVFATHSLTTAAASLTASTLAFVATAMQRQDRLRTRIRAQIRAQVQAQVQAQIRAQFRGQIRAQYWAGFLLLAVGVAVLPARAASAPAQADLYADPAPAPVPGATTWQRIELGAKGRRYTFPVYASQRLNTPATLRKVQRLVIVLHDERREAERGVDVLTKLYAGQAEHQTDTLVVAPRFPGAVDSGFDGMPVWRRADWMDGLPSTARQGRPAPVGAFQVIDDLLRELTAPNRLPSLHAIVLVGHGAGAQMAQRYAVLNPMDESLRATGLSLTYVIANADSYLYLSPERPSRNGRGYARYERGICPTYDHYRYGLDAMPSVIEAYQGKLDPARLAARYAQRRVTYLLGSADTNPESPGLDKSCGAEAQGATPLARGLEHWSYETSAPKSTLHRGFIVMGAGHDEASLYASACGAQTLLGDGDWNTSLACKALNPGARR